MSVSLAADETTARAARVVIVTGSGSGIGRAACERFARDGCTVVSCDVDLASAEATLALCGGRGCALAMDVCSEAEVEAGVAAAIKRFGRLDVAFNNAGVEGERAAVGDSSVENWDRVLNTNARGCFLCMKHELRVMGEARRGVIVNAASTVGTTAMAEFSAYCASKHAILGLTKCAAKEYAGRGVRVVAVCPSTTGTPMVDRFAAAWPEWQARQNASFPMGRIGTAAEVAEAVFWLSGEACPFITGTSLTIDGGAGC